MNFTSDNLFLCLPHCLSFNRKKPFPVPIPKPECTVALLIFIAATPVGASISNLDLSGFPLLHIKFKDMVIVLTACDFPTSAAPVRRAPVI